MRIDGETLISSPFWKYCHY